MGTMRPATTIDSGPERIAVVVPAHDEEHLLPRLLDSLVVARNQLPPAFPCTIVVVADACRDQTVSVARARLGDHDVVVECEHRCVGSARRLGSAIALAGAEPARTWLANTDADSVVPPTWLTDQLALAHAGVRAVAGVVDLDSVAPALRQRFERTYRISGDGTHEHVHGANLGLRGDVYLRAGGWHALCTAEEHDLWSRVRLGGGVLATSALAVRTSGRLVGRAPSSFADGLAELMAGTA